MSPPSHLIKLSRSSSCLHLLALITFSPLSLSLLFLLTYVSLCLAKPVFGVPSLSFHIVSLPLSFYCTYLSLLITFLNHFHPCLSLLSKNDVAFQVKVRRGKFPACTVQHNYMLQAFQWHNSGKPEEKKNTGPPLRDNVLSP